jgi:hypothetical protein
MKITPTEFMNAEHLNKFYNGDAKALLSWQNDDGTYTSLMNFQEPHSCRDRMFVMHQCFVGQNIDSTVRSADTYDFERALYYVEQQINYTKMIKI